MKKIIVFAIIFIFCWFLTPFLKYYLTAIFTNLALPGWSIGVLAAVVSWFITFVLSVLLFLKPLVLQDLSKEQEFILADPYEFPQLDVESLQRYTEDLESIGFVKIIDFKISTQQVSFARIFLHPQHQCWAEVSQIFLHTKSMPIISTIMSVFDNGYSLSSSDRKLSGLLFGRNFIIRHPQILWMSHPGITQNKLLEIHLQRRREIAHILNLKIAEVTDDSLDVYCDFQRELRIKRKQDFQRKNIAIGLVESLLFDVNPKQEWMGEYGDAVATKMRS